MNKTESHCLLCSQLLKTSISWTTLLTKQFTPTICTSCSARFEQSQSVTAIYQYNEAMKVYLHQFKFLQDIALAKVFRQELYARFNKEKAIILPIPMHPIKQQERTFSHTDELLKAANIPFIQLLEKTTTETQGSKNREQRLRATPLFRLKVRANVEHKDYLLFDDIKATGTTLQHAAEVLMQAGAKNVQYFTLIEG
ncbi:ComF family protein [Lysinibacillus sphaericus]|uniref:Competence protein ComFC n=3 Tax=Lysinibacillus TaxID=400634 RepID=W7RH89_LYSSH|nr:MULTISPECIES: ComF family protein [Lysinibacillus]MBE5084756.1 ComF family protein [Bacillus thuringiensis]ACA38757.1 late competence protein comFC-like protein [Lysinibacillus sphaericus C3-41]AMO34987.1 competence protein ComFC [Lysinibacillus sphaericus]AMR89898.1 competence protein ComFC [Lysinibacillus sphaericus]ANA47968.1 competence protein ComFC [Lysinibacillus sphaericus]